MAFVSQYEDIDAETENLEIIENEGDDLFVDLVAERPWLYNKCAIGYSDQIMTYNAWKDISTILNDTIENCKTRWQRILNSYSREKLQRDKESRSGSGAPKRRIWPLYERMKSLMQRNINQSNKSITNVASTSGYTQYPQKCFSSSKHQKMSNNHQSDLIQSMFNSVNAKVTKIEEKLHTKPQKDELKDPDDLFGNLIAAELNELSSKEAKRKRKLFMRYLSELDSD